MNDDRQAAGKLLEALYAAERGHLLLRVPEIAPFADRRAAGHLRTVRQLAQEAREHLDWLAEAAEACGAGIAPAAPPADAGHLHYLDLRTLLPRLIESTERLLERYRSCSARQAAGKPEVDEVLTRILGRHQIHLETLNRIRAELESPTPA